MCEASDPEFFTLDEDGYSSIGLDKEVLAAQENQVRLGVQSCPMGALSISDD
ncbi:ferredoxin [Mycobacterium vicinigordonae]